MAQMSGYREKAGMEIVLSAGAEGRFAGQGAES